MEDNTESKLNDIKLLLGDLSSNKKLLVTDVLSKLDHTLSALDEIHKKRLSDPEFLDSILFLHSMTMRIILQSIKYLPDFKDATAVGSKNQ